MNAAGARRPGCRQPRDISRVFSELRRSEKWGRHLSENLVFRIWEEAVGEAVARVARPVSLGNGRLRVEVSNPAWMQELHLMSEEIRAKLNEVLEGGKIEEIRFEAGQGRGEGAGIDCGAHNGYAYREPPPDAAITSDDEIAVRGATGRFEDTDFRDRVERLMERVRERTSEPTSEESPKIYPEEEE